MTTPDTDYEALQIPATCQHDDVLLAFSVRTGTVVALLPDDARDLYEAGRLYGWTPAPVSGDGEGDE